LAHPIPKITVVVAAYCPGPAIHRVIDSLDAQTLPQAEFETIIVDDGSPDDTFEQLTALAATRPNLTVTRIENSGWPSRPRNVGTRMARGEYVFYMDHDDSLYPDALRRLSEFAAESRADFISPKESKTTDPWWGMSSLAAGNTSDLRPERVTRLLPMVPHKLYRREFLLANDISFPEGRRMLWEDVFFNVEVYAKANRVAILADTPVYLWHDSGANNSKTYAPTDTEYWDRLDELMAFIDRTLSSPELAEARRLILLHQYRERVLKRLERSLLTASEAGTAIAMSRALAIQQAYIPPVWDQAIGALARPRTQLLREQRPDLLRMLATALRQIKGSTQATAVAWEDGALRIEATSRWLDGEGLPFTFLRSGGRVVMPLPEELAAAIPLEMRDLTDLIGMFSLTIGVRARAESVTWQLPGETTVTLEPMGDDRVSIVAHTVVRLDPETAAHGRPLAPTVWELTSISRWHGVHRTTALKTRIAPLPALLRGAPAVAFGNGAGSLSVDLAQRLHSIVGDGGVPSGPVTTTASGFELALPRVQVFGDGRSELAVVPLDVTGTGQAGNGALSATLVGDAAGARLVVSGRVPRGASRLSFRSATATVASDIVITSRANGHLKLDHRQLQTPRRRLGLFGRRVMSRLSRSSRRG
jgi:glycosyltransferase involved in cell wall biosynthesis